MPPRPGDPGISGPRGETGQHGFKGDRGEIGLQGPPGNMTDVDMEHMKGDKGDIGAKGIEKRSCVTMRFCYRSSMFCSLLSLSLSQMSLLLLCFGLYQNSNWDPNHNFERYYSLMTLVLSGNPGITGQRGFQGVSGDPGMPGKDGESGLPGQAGDKLFGTL